MRQLQRTGYLLAAMAATLLVGGCPPFDSPEPAREGPPALQPFGSAEELLAFFKEQVRARRAADRQTTLFGWVPLLGAAAPSDEAAGGGEEDGTDYSTTNLQEEGVDESDVVKSDGRYLYIAKGQSLRIVKAEPAADLAQVAQLEFDQEIHSLYLLDGTLLVLGQAYGIYGPVPLAEFMMWPPYYPAATTLISQVDISDPENPAITAENELDGSLVESRLTNGRLIVVLTIAPELPDAPTAAEIDALTLEDVMPEARTAAGSAFMVPPENWYHPAAPDGYNTTAVLTLDAADIDTVLGSVAVLASAGTIYASTAALYLTDTQYTSDNDYRERTAVHKLAFNDEGVAEYVASGSVPGRLLNQFSLGEYEGYLRLATHVENFELWWGGGDIAVGVAEPNAGAQTRATEPPAGPYNALYVLGEVEGGLAIVGAVENYAPEEQIYSARFLGPRGFVVTFQQVDPLFTFDLSDPEHPQLVGELEVPGYSDYLHPWGENLLIGVGRSVVGSPWGGVLRDAVQLSLFDVSDLANPTLIDQLELGGYGSESDVSSTHKAFTFMPDSGLLALPAALWSEDTNPETGYGGGPEFDGVVCLRLTEQGFEQLGRVDSVVYDESYWWTPWRRGAFIGDVLYAITPAGVRAAAVDDFETTHEVVLTPNAAEVGDDEGGGDGSGGATEPGSAGR